MNEESDQKAIARRLAPDVRERFNIGKGHRSLSSALSASPVRKRRSTVLGGILMASSNAARDNDNNLVKGSHHHFKHSTLSGRVTVQHPRLDIPTGTLRNIYRQAGWKWR